MPLQILPKETNWGESLGSSLGAGLGSGLEQLANLKMQQYMQRQQATRTQSALEQYGIPKNQAQAVSMMNPNMQQAYFKDYLQAPEQERIYQAFRAMMPNQSMGQDQFSGQGMEGMPGGLEQSMQQLAPEMMPYQGGMIPGTGMPLKTQMQMPQQMQQQSQPQQGMPQQMQQQPGGFQMPPKGRMSIQNAKYFTDLMMKQQGQQQKQGRWEQEQIAKESKAIQPFLHERATMLQGIESEAKTAREMVDIIKKHGGKMPGSVMGNMPRIAQNMWYDDPDIKRYMNLADTLVVNASQDVKGRPSQYMTKLIEASKAGLNLPNKAKLQKLEEYLNEADVESRKEKYIKSQRDPKTGQLPRDIETRASNWSEARAHPLDWPEYYKLNWKITDEDTGKSYVRIEKNGKPDWRKL
jgi:hypothetical protein